MKIIFIHRWQRRDDRLTQRVERELEKLAETTRIEVAEVTFERTATQSPPYLVRMHLAVPGPDLHAEQTDHTPQAALRKVLDRLSRMLRQRKQAHVAKRKWESGATRDLGARPALGLYPT